MALQVGMAEQTDRLADRGLSELVLVGDRLHQRTDVGHEGSSPLVVQPAEQREAGVHAEGLAGRRIDDRQG